MNRLPVAGLATPARRVSRSRLVVEGVTAAEDRGVVAGMTFGRCHEADPAVVEELTDHPSRGICITTLSRRPAPGHQRPVTDLLRALGRPHHGHRSLRRARQDVWYPRLVV